MEGGEEFGIDKIISCLIAELYVPKDQTIKQSNNKQKVDDI